MRALHHRLRMAACDFGKRRRRQQSSLHEPIPPGEVPVPPSRKQLRALFVSSAIPMIGFGFMDQTVMLQAGHAIDLTIGVTFGLSTLTAAAFGQVCSDAAGVLFGGTLDNLAKAAGLPRSGLTSVQRALPVVKRVKLAGNLIGVMTGCCLGLLNLLFIDHDRASTLKLQAMSEEQEFAFEVEASNAVRDDATVLTVRGPDVDGVLASMTSALAGMNCSLVELNARRGPENTSKGHAIEDVFILTKRGSDDKIPDDELDELALALLEGMFVTKCVNHRAVLKNYSHVLFPFINKPRTLRSIRPRSRHR